MSQGPTRLFIASAALLLIAAPAFAEEESGTITEAIKNGTPNVDLRYRFEGVDQDGIAEDASASTIRVRVGYRTGTWRGWQAFGELEGVDAVGSDRYDSTANGRTSFPTVPDPEDAEVNQAYVAYKGLKNTVFKLGRQRIKLDNDRFVGNVGWRQNEQTFDAYTLVRKFGEKTTLTVSQINNANRIFGEHHPDSARADLDLNMQVAHAAHVFGFGTLTGYAHFIENEEAPVASHRNLGLRFVGKRSFSDNAALLYTGEYANQSDHADAPSTVDADYTFVELGVGLEPVTVKLGYELLGGDGVYGFQTPLATLHAFNGWTDKFLSATPAEGLEDIYLLVVGKCQGWKLVGVYHEFAADEGGADYGDEFGFMAARTFKKHYSVGFKYASYGADSFATDTDKFWITLQVKR